MVIAPCSIHTMSAIAGGISSNLMIRAADVILKERRKLILMVRESPFHLGHLRNMTALAEMGAIIAPPIPGFYHHPQTVDDLVDHQRGPRARPDRPARSARPAVGWGDAVSARRPVIAFQGERGAFSQEATRRLCGPDVEVLPCHAV